MPLFDNNANNSWYPDRQNLLWAQGKIKNGGTAFFQAAQNASAVGFITYQNPAAVNDEIQLDFPLRLGSYFLDIYAVKGPTQGIVQFYFNNSQLGADLDKYSATVIQLISRFSISVLTPGMQSFRSKVIGKNSSSTGYFNSNAIVLVTPQ